MALASRKKLVAIESGEDELSQVRGTIEPALRVALVKPTGEQARSLRVPWVTTPGGLPPGVGVSDREQMYDWIRRQS